jgi:flagellar biosynthesis/type III secretory pathway chaperone
MAAPKMQTALDYYEKGVPIDAIREVVQKDDTAVNMRRMFDVVLEKLNKAKEQMPQDLEYVKSLVAQMDEVVAKINHQNERYDALNKKLSEIETSKVTRKSGSVWSRRTRIRTLLSTVSRMN